MAKSHPFPVSSRKTQINTKAISSKKIPQRSTLTEYKEKDFDWCLNTLYLHKKSDQYNLLLLEKDDILKIFNKLDDYRSWKWKQIEMSHNGTSSGKMEVRHLDKKELVFDHFKACRLEEQDELYKIEIKGTHRIWGIRRGSTLYIIWNDAQHEFYKPLRKNYTPPQKVS